MTKWSIVRRISVYGGSFTSVKKRIMLAPTDSTQIWSFSAMHTLINTGNKEEEELLEKIVNNSKNDSNFISKIDYTNLTEKYLKSGNLSGAYDLLKSSQDKNISLPDLIFKKLLTAAAEQNDIKLSCKIFKELLVSGKPLTSDCYLNLARAFINTDDSTQLSHFLKEVSESSSLPGRLIVINRTILAFAESRQIHKVLSILKDMQEWETKPDVITYNTILDLLGRAGHVTQMLKLFISMQEDCNVSLDIITYNTVLNGLRKACRFDMCLVLYNEMVQSGLKPDLLTYTAVIDSFGRSGNIKESLRLFEEMKERKIRPSVYVYRALIDSLKKSGEFEKSLEISDELKLNTSSSNLAGQGEFKRHLRTHRS